MRASEAAQTHSFPLPVHSWTWDMTDRPPVAIHQPVLLEEVLSFLQPERGRLFVDATIGLGGHARAILSAGSRTEVLGIDRDTEALNGANQRLADFQGRYNLV